MDNLWSRRDTSLTQTFVHRLIRLEAEARDRGIVGPICYCTDGHGSRFFQTLLTWGREQDVDGNPMRDLYITPPNATGTLCWLDQLFQHLHNAYSTHIQQLKSAYGLTMRIDKYEAVSAVCEFWSTWATEATIKRAMRVCGLCPDSMRWCLALIPPQNFMLSKKWLEDRELALQAVDAAKPSWRCLSMPPASPGTEVLMILPNEGYNPHPHVTVT